uniref:Protein kinase domain-containing protein n=1 Tax=Psilocybe cubensis TaxID=181762 RepID=A0A8H7Y5C7_PSICU
MVLAEYLLLHIGDHPFPSVRPQIAHEMEREFVRCEFDAFMKAYLPFVPDDADVKECIDKKLRPRQLMGGTDASKLCFNHYRAPPTTASSEMETYKSIQDIAHAVGLYAHPTRKRNQFHYRDTPYSHITSETFGSTHKVDACFTSDPTPSRSNNKAMKLNTTSMAVPLGFKLSSSKRHENNKKIVSANVQIMNGDVRRMFTFGITIECDQVTLWFHCRSHSAISVPFSFVTEPKKLIKVFMSILFATDEARLRPVGNDGGPVRHFQVIRPISIYRSNNITGRMSRIFKVTEVNSNPPSTFVLKDVWIEESANTEGQIQEAIFADIEKFWQETTLPEEKEGLANLKRKHAALVASKGYKDYFLSIETDLEGSLSKDIVPAYSLQRGLFNPPLRAKQRSVFSGQGSRHSAGTPRPISNAEKPQTLHRDYLQKKQYRVVFKEVCKSIGELVYVGEVIDVLRQVLTPLQLMFCAGWVHRDISCGNILAHMHDAKWQVKLSDLEYAKQFPPPQDYKPATDPKTGTPYFMPHEILDRRYLYIASDAAPDKFASYAQLRKQKDQKDADTQQPATPDVTVSQGEQVQDSVPQIETTVQKDSTVFNAQKELPAEAISDSSNTEQVDHPKLDQLPPLNRRNQGNGDQSDGDVFGPFEHEETNPFLEGSVVINDGPEDSDASYEDEDDDDDDDDAETKPNRIVVHNFQHDLESLWWVLLWNITARSNRKISNEWARDVFHNSLNLTWARRACIIDEVLTDMKRILAKPLKCFAPHIEDLRHFLKREYVTREELGDLDSFESYVPIHNAFETVFNSLLSELPSTWRKVKLVVNGPEDGSGEEILHTTLSPGSGAQREDNVAGTEANGPTAAASGVAQLEKPARIKRELSEDELTPARRAGPSKRSKRGNAD